MPFLQDPYTPILVLMVAALGFALTPLALAWLWARKFSPRKPGPDKNATYECGLESKGDAWIQFKAEYYLYAIIFLIFDVETIFLLPFAVAFTGLSRRRVHCDDDVPAAPGRRPGLGVAKGRVDVEVKRGSVKTWKRDVNVEADSSIVEIAHFNVLTV